MQLGKWNPTENCFLTTYHPSFMVHWWVLLVHSGHANHGHNCINAKKTAMFFWTIYFLLFLSFVHYPLHFLELLKCIEIPIAETMMKFKTSM
jgi:hypothetical protein